jgi:GntR family transcriptional repressor for pyruvate dehydrogenase complex
MKNVSDFAPLRRQRLSDELVDRVLALIASDQMRIGDRLPPIAEMAKTFGVASTTMREALMRLEARHAIAIRHGSGVFVTAGPALESSH